MSTRGQRATGTLAVTLILMLVATHSAMAQSRAGVHAGISADPAQFYFGGHVELAEVVKQLWFRPNVEVGVGDGVTVAAFNGEFVYLPTVKSRKWNPYFGGGPGLVLRTFRSGPSGRSSDVGPGFNLVIGVEQRKGLMAEVKVGALDSPGFKLGIGWTW